jgi:conjugal transfer/entry exclusion protein
MKSIAMIGALLIASAAFAQAPPPALSTDPQQIENLIQATGCRAEVTAAAQTIANLQKQINELQKQLKDPPKSGATKH